MTEPHHSPQQHDDNAVGSTPVGGAASTGPVPTAPASTPAPSAPSDDSAAPAAPGSAADSSGQAWAAVPPRDTSSPITGPVPSTGPAQPAHGPTSPAPFGSTPSHGSALPSASGSTDPHSVAGQAPYGSPSYGAGQPYRSPSSAAPTSGGVPASPTSGGVPASPGSGGTPASPQGWSRDSATDPGTGDTSTWARYQSATPAPNAPTGGTPVAPGSPQSGSQWAGWTPSTGRPQPTSMFPATSSPTSDDYARAMRGAPTPHATAAPRKRRGRTVTAVIAATALALGAGFGGGVLATNLNNQASPASVDSSLSPSSTNSEISNPVAGTGSVEAVANTLLPSVVSILAVSSQGSGEGSGIILTEDGLILTNNHVVSGADQLTVRFNDGTTAKATLVGATATDDLAVIQVEGVSGLTKATLGASGDLQVGQQVVAVGSPLGLSATVTTGIVSALNRPVRTGSTESDETILNAIQTDAAINPGNSGGPLVDMNGHVIGINSAIATMSSDGSSQAGSIGVGFAIPIDQAYRIAQEIINTGSASRAVLGASVADASTSQSPLSSGAELMEITSGGGAEAAGLAKGDVVTKIGDVMIESADALIAAVRSQQPGGTVSVTYIRGSQTETVEVNLGSAAAD